MCGVVDWWVVGFSSTGEGDNIEYVQTLEMYIISAKVHLLMQQIDRNYPKMCQMLVDREYGGSYVFTHAENE